MATKKSDTETNGPDGLPPLVRVEPDPGSTTPFPVTVADSVDVKLSSAAHSTIDQPLWVAIRGSARALTFKSYKQFIDQVFCPDPKSPLPFSTRHVAQATPNFDFGIDAYQLLRAATEAFVLDGVGVNVPADYSQAEENSRFGG